VGDWREVYGFFILERARSRGFVLIGFVEITSEGGGIRAVLFNPILNW
jgi:hypothetical protein